MVGSKISLQSAHKTQGYTSSGPSPHRRHSRAAPVLTQDKKKKIKYHHDTDLISATSVQAANRPEQTRCRDLALSAPGPLLP